MVSLEGRRDVGEHVALHTSLMIPPLLHGTLHAHITSTPIPPTARFTVLPALI